ncbi:hypothetical protein, partial [Agromyces seonyuensis]
MSPTRSFARRGVLTSIALVVLLLAGFGAAVSDLVGATPAAGLRTGIAEASGADGAARWEVFRSADPDAQSAAADRVFDALPAGLAVSRSVQTSPAPAGGAGFSVDGAAVGAVLLVDPDASAHADLVTGAWPEDAGAAPEGAVPAAVHAGAADALGLALGDEVALDGLTLVVVGTWLPSDAGDPHWAGDPLLAGGLSGERAGPFLLADEAATDALSVGVYARWTAVPTGGLDPGSAAEVRSELPRIADRLADEPGFRDGGVRESGALAGTLDRLLAEAGAVGAIAPVPLLLLAVAGAAALERLGSLLAASRRSETVLLRARGATAARIGRETAVEVLVIGIPAAVVGALCGEGLLVLAAGGAGRSWAAALAAAAVAAV